MPHKCHLLRCHERQAARLREKYACTCTLLPVLWQGWWPLQLQGGGGEGGGGGTIARLKFRFNLLETNALVVLPDAAPPLQQELSSSRS